MIPIEFSNSQEAKFSRERVDPFPSTVGMLVKIEKTKVSGTDTATYKDFVFSYLITYARVESIENHLLSVSDGSGLISLYIPPKSIEQWTKLLKVNTYYGFCLRPTIFYPG